MDGERPDVVVVGGGVIGVGCAWRLAARGLSVTVVDPDPGTGASRAAGGMLAPISEATDWNEALLRLGLASALRYPSFVAELEEASGLDVDYRPFGTLIVARHDVDRALVDALADFAEGLHLDVRRVDGARCVEMEPLLHPDVRGGLHVPGDHAVDNRRFYAALRVASERAGVTFLARAAARLRVDGDRATGVDLAPADGGSREDRVDADVVVLASGTASATLPGVPDADVPPVRPVKGEILRLHVPQERRPLLSRCVRGTVDGNDVYLVPRADGELVVGATAEERDDRVSTAGGVHRLLCDAIAMVPEIEGLHFTEAFAALRPGSDDGPVIGATGLAGLVVATGHHRNGILLTPVTADAVAATVLGEEPPAEALAFPADRTSRAGAAA